MPTLTQQDPMSETPLVARTPDHRAGTTHVPVGHARPDAHAVTLGDGAFVVAAGPCSVEGASMIVEAARGVAAGGARLLRGGAFKPRTSPYAFQGLGAEGLAMLAEARAATGLPVVTEVLDVRHVDLVARHADMLQVGARNMYNAPLLAAVGDTRLPVLLKRSFAATIRELIAAAEYVAVRGNTQVVLCERGIRTFEPATRNTLDVAAIPVLKKETHLPVIVDPSHAAGRAEFVAPLACAALAAGADGLIAEVHPDPASARSDGEQSLTLPDFASMMQRLAALAHAMHRPMVPLGADVRVLSIGRGRHGGAARTGSEG